MRSWIAAAILSVRALREAPIRTGVTIGLVSFSCLVVSCTADLTLNMAGDVRGLAASDAPDRAMLLPRGRRGWTHEQVTRLSATAASRGTLEQRRWTTVTIRVIADGRATVRAVPVACVSAAFPTEKVQWTSTEAMGSWIDRPSPGIIPTVIGSALLPADTLLPRTMSLESSVGPLTVVGRLRPIPGLTFDARLNGALIIPAMPGHDRAAHLCRGRADEVLLRTGTPEALDRLLQDVEDVVRTEDQLRPAVATPMVVVTDDVVRRLVAKVMQAVGPWIWFGPLAIALVCGIGALAVNLVHGIDRIHEFGVMRCAGATRRDLVRQMCAEAAIVTVASAALPLVSLLMSAFADGGGEGLAHAADAAALGLMLAGLLSLIGVMIPGLHAARTSRVAGLERAGL